MAEVGWVPAASTGRQHGEEPGLTRESLAAKLAANPAYQAALLASGSESWDGPGIEASAMIEAANERRRAAMCTDVNDPLYEDWVVDPDPASIPPEAWGGRMTE